MAIKHREYGTSAGDVKAWATRKGGGGQSDSEVHTQIKSKMDQALAQGKGAEYRKAKTDLQDHERYTSAKARMASMGAKTISEYVSKAKDAGYTVTKKDQENLSKAFQKFHKETGVQEKTARDLVSVLYPKAKKKSEETISASTVPQLSRAAVKKESEAVAISETAGATSSSAGSKFEVVLIQEGLGNLHDCAYYSREALMAGPVIFEGKKLFVDHPSYSEERDRPERTVRDIGGYFEGVHFDASSGRGQLMGNLVVLPGQEYDWIRNIMSQSIKYTESTGGDLIGLSINANGDAEAMAIEDLISKNIVPQPALAKVMLAREQGVTEVQYVAQFTSAVSCDLVTEAGAGGRVLKILERDKPMAKKQVKAKEADKHDDAAQDKELIQSMLKKHDSEEASIDEAHCGVVKEAYESAMEMGMKGEEAEKAAVMTAKMMKHMAGKKEAADGEEKKEADVEEAKDSDQADQDPKEDKKDDDKDQKEADVEEKKESAKVMKMAAEIATLRETNRKFEVSAHLEKILAESKLPMSVTKTFREHAKAIKAVEGIDQAFGIFKEAYGLGGKAQGLFTPEKSEVTDGERMLSFESCVQKD